MRKITVKAPAKLNLFLNVVGRRDDGYHLIESVMQSVDLFDIVTIEKMGNLNVEIMCNNPAIPCNEKNIVYKAVKAIFDYKQLNIGVRIDIEKNIPIEAGMGGSSADGAAVIFGMNKLFELNLSDGEMIKIAEDIGADVPFMIFGGTSLARGIGEKLEKLDIPKLENVLLVKPEVSINTREAYKKIDLENVIQNKHIEEFCRDILNNEMFNVFEAVAPEEIGKIKNEMKGLGATNAIMTGSGSAVFGIFDSNTIKNAEQEIKKIYKNVFICKAISEGVTICELE